MNLKNKLTSLSAALLAATALSAQIKPNAEWLDNKYSMFIHFGLYSKLGGVWNGKPVTQGYSEQIQSFAGIFSDWYASVADTFAPERWNPDSVVALAKKAGMRSIVFTSKHHDGFCMYHSKETDFNIVDATPYGRDPMKELADACRRGGIGFSVYFSLIDWHYPEAYPISSHNTDPLTEAHYQYNLRQVEEIMRNYGKISEIWFDMGCLTPQQSKGLYELVESLQPSCMISGRLGNNYSDFSVLADNEYPDVKMEEPWQSAASMFDETWGYRSWQQRGKVSDKIREKLRCLIKVVSRGGNYLLNIGPDGDGNVIPFEREVLEGMGEWVKAHGEAIYATRPNPLNHAFDHGEVTCNDHAVYLFLYERPSDGKIRLNDLSAKPSDVSLLTVPTEHLKHAYRKGELTITLPETFQLDSVASVVKIAFDEGYDILPENFADHKQLRAENAEKIFGYSSLDYYCGFKSIAGYRWHYKRQAPSAAPSVYFTDNEAGRKIELTVDGIAKTIMFDKKNAETQHMEASAVRWGKVYTKRGRGIFGNMPDEGRSLIDTQNEKSGWTELSHHRPGELVTRKAGSFYSEMMLVNVEATDDTLYPVEVVGTNSFYVLVNGEYLSADFPEERLAQVNATLLLPLKKGANQIVLKSFDRFDKDFAMGIRPIRSYNLYKIKADRFNTSASREHVVEMRAADAHSRVKPIRLENIRIDMSGE